MIAILAGTSGAAQEPPPASESSLSMSPALLALYREEMRQLLVGTQAVALALPVADWDGIIATSRQMRDSYVLEQQLTPAQQAEIAGLPEKFLELDHGFHARTEKLAAAAEEQDPEAVAYQFSRLLETCAACHAEFGQSRFPAFRPGAGQTEHDAHGDGN